MGTKRVTATSRSPETGDGGVRPADASSADASAMDGRNGRPTLLGRLTGSGMAETATVPSDATAARRPGRGHALAAVVRRIPFTTAVVLVILAAGIATGSLWTPISERTWFPDIAYGLP